MSKAEEQVRAVQECVATWRQSLRRASARPYLSMMLRSCIGDIKSNGTAEWR